jgi:Holliday junction resolvase-like predicted endonuclease
MKSLQKDELSHVQLGTIGEYLVAAKLMEMGLDVHIANMSINNCAKYDLIAVDTHSLRHLFVQVKTSQKKSFPVGMTLEDACNTEMLKQKIVGPWIFLDAQKKGDSWKYEFYVLDKEEVIDLIYKSNNWYIYGYERNGNTLSLNNICALNLRWLRGEVEPKTKRHKEFSYPLLVDAKDRWDKIKKCLEYNKFVVP